MRLPLRLLGAGLLCAAPLSASAQSATAILTVQVDNVSPKGGNLRLSLYDSANYSEGSGGESVVDVVVPAQAPLTNITLPPVPPGTYAIKMFQDYNKNGEFDFTWIGLPAERYGFSNNASPLFSEPSFDRVKFDLTAGEHSQVIRLQ